MAMRSVSILMQLVQLVLLLLLSMFAESATGSLEQHYIGCYGDKYGSRAIIDRQFAWPRLNMTHEMCRKLCTTYTYFGVQYSMECFCGHKYNRHGRHTNCNMTCAGNQSQTCGGYWAVSVYSVCPFGFYGLNCTDRCYCLNTTQHDERCFMNGTCPAGCQARWTGPTCATDVCICANCQHICVNTSGSHSCACYEGYTLDANGTNCIDVNECEVENGRCEQKCINTAGNFNCSCYTEHYTLNIDGRTCVLNLPSAVDSRCACAAAVWVVVVPSVVAGLAIIAVVALFCYITRLRSRLTTADVTAPSAAGAVLDDCNTSPIYYEDPVEAGARGISESLDGNVGQRADCGYSTSAEYMELNQRHCIEAVYEHIQQS